jgi:hypothetical protein
VRVEAGDDDDDNDHSGAGRNDSASDDDSHYDDATDFGSLLGGLTTSGRGHAERVPFLCLRLFRFFRHRFRALLFLFRLANDRRDRLKFLGAAKVH